MINKKILLDTNIFMRLLENNAKYNRILDYYFYKDFDFVISDHSLFEILDFLDRHNDVEGYKNVIFFLNKYEVCLMFRKGSEKFYKNYNSFLFQKYSMGEAKNLLYESFKFALTRFLSNVYMLTILYLANSLENSYTSNFYTYIRKIFKKRKVYNLAQNHVGRIVNSGYISNSIEVNRYVKQELKDTVIQIICYYNIFKEDEIINEKKFNDEFKRLKILYNKENFKDIVSKYARPNVLQMKNIDGLDEISYSFIKEYINDLCLEGASFSINDAVDFLNFLNAYEKNIYYYTLDTNSLKKYSRYFEGETKVLEYLEKIKEIENIPYNVLVKI